MPITFKDLPTEISDMQLLSLIAFELSTKGVIFERDAPRQKKVISTAVRNMQLRVSRLMMIEDMYIRGMSSDTNITCDGCDQRFTCRSAYDAYNTDGDCLEDK